MSAPRPAPPLRPRETWAGGTRRRAAALAAAVALLGARDARGEVAAHALPLGDGVQVALALPASAAKEPDSALPAIDVSKLTGATVPVRLAVRLDGDARLRVVCARGPSDRWVPGLEELLFQQATALAARATGEELGPLSEVAHVARAPRLERRLVGESARARLEVRHVLAFAGARADAILCTAACYEPQGGAACTESLDRVSLEGALRPAPPAGILAEAAIAALERPRHALAVTSVVAALATVVVLALRPRPRP